VPLEEDEQFLEDPRVERVPEWVPLWGDAVKVQHHDRVLRLYVPEKPDALTR
jgi:hypothetical protein